MTNRPSTAESRRRLLELIQGYRTTQVLYAAASLGIAEALRGDPRDSRDLAAAVGAHEPSLVRLLRALISLGLVRLDPDDRYGLTDAGTLLDGESPASVRAGILFEGSKPYEHWGDLVDSVRTGQNTYQRRYGVDGWTYRVSHPEWGKLTAAVSSAAVSSKAYRRMATPISSLSSSTTGMTSQRVRSSPRVGALCQGRAACCLSSASFPTSRAARCRRI
jgi:Dimerisation domain